MSTVILIRETWSHMTDKSGFDPLMEKLSQVEAIHAISLFVDDFRITAKPKPWQRILKKQHSIDVHNACSPFVEKKHERVAQEAVKLMKQFTSALVFLSVTENQFAPAFEKLTDSELSRFVLFVHQPPAWFRLHWRLNTVFKKVKAIVCLCHDQANYFTDLGVQHVVVIKHGVNLSFFSPDTEAKQISKNIKLIFVGQWLRDIDVLSESFHRILEVSPNVELHAVYPLRNRLYNAPIYRLAQTSLVYWYHDVSSEKLRELYRCADCLVLPLLDATANNALNEAMACGLPVVTTAIGGTSDYVYPHASKLALPNNAVDFANQCLTMLRNLPEMKQQQEAIRKHAEATLNWDAQVEIIRSSIWP